MKVLLAVAVFLFVLQETSGSVPPGGFRPPSYVRSAVFANRLGHQIHVKVTFSSTKTRYYGIDAGKSVTVERTIPHHGWSSVDPIQSFKVYAGSNGMEEVHVHANGVERQQYEIGAPACPKALHISRHVY